VFCFKTAYFIVDYVTMTGLWHLKLHVPVMNSLNKTEAAISHAGHAS